MAVEDIGADTSSSLPSTINDSGVANTKGTYTELVASSSFTAGGIIISPYPASGRGDFLFDIATGAAASETDIIANMGTGCSSVSNSNQIWNPMFVPVSIASGSRVSCRWQSNNTANAMRLMAHLIAVDSVELLECTSVTTYGANTTDSGGVTIDPGGSANTKGAWTEITASTSANHQWWIVSASSNGNTAMTNNGWLVDVGTGAGGAETAIIDNIPFTATIDTDIIFPVCFPAIPVAVSSGTRISVRAQSLITDATDRLIDIKIYGLSGTHVAGGGGTSFHGRMS